MALEVQGQRAATLVTTSAGTVAPALAAVDVSLRAAGSHTVAGVGLVLEAVWQIQAHLVGFAVPVALEVAVAAVAALAISAALVVWAVAAVVLPPPPAQAAQRACSFTTDRTTP